MKKFRSVCRRVPAGSSKKFRQAHRNVPPVRRKFPAGSLKSSDRLDERFCLNHQKVPIASTKSSVQIAERFCPSRQRVPTSATEKFRIIKYFRISKKFRPDYQEVPAQKIPDYQKFRLDYQEVLVQKFRIIKSFGRIIKKLRFQKFRFKKFRPGYVETSGITRHRTNQLFCQNKSSTMHYPAPASGQKYQVLSFLCILSVHVNSSDNNYSGL